MTVSTTIIKNFHNGNGSATNFAYQFRILQDTDLLVIIRTNSTGAETTKTLSTHYTVAGAGDASGGSITFTSGNVPASGETVVIRRNVPQTQAIDYIANDPFPAETHEEGLDRATMVAQQVGEESDRSIKLSRTNTMTSTEFTVGATERAGKILAFDTSGELSVTQELGTFKGNSATTTTAAYVVRDIVKGTTAAQLNNIYICIQASPIGTALTNTSYWVLIVDAVSAATSATAAASSATASANSATASANSATTSANSATTSGNSATASANSATASANSATAAAASADAFDDIYLGTKSSDPSTDNDGDALAAGMLYFNSTNDILSVYNGSSWQNAAVDTTGFTTLTGTETLTNKTLTLPKINENVAVTSTATELNLLDGVSGLVQADLTKLAAIDATAAEIDTLDALSRGSIIYGNASAATAILTKGGANTVLTSDGTDIAWSAVDAGIEWQTIVTGSTLTAVAGRGYWINTSSNTCTITLPGSASNGDQIIFADYARNWGTNKIIIDSNGLKYQGQTDAYTVEYSTNGETLNIVYSGATNGWIPLDDDAVADEPVAPATQRAIFAFGDNGSIVGTSNLVNSSGVVQADVAAVGTGRREMSAANYGGDKAIFYGGVTANGYANASRITNLVNAAGVVASDTANASGVTAKYATAMTNFGSSGQALYAFGINGSNAFVNTRNIISNTGSIANDVTGAGTAKTTAKGAPYGGDKAIIAYGYPDPSTNASNLVTNLGVVGADRTGVGTARTHPGAAGYGGDKAIFAYGEYTAHVNLVSNTGVVATDTTAGGTARNLGSGATYGGDKALFWGGNADPGGKLNISNLVTNLGVVGANQSGVGTAKKNYAGSNINYTA